MTLPIELSKNLSIVDICGLASNDDSAVIITFHFYGQECTGVFARRHIEKEWLSYASLEAPTDLADSFEDTLEEHIDTLKSTYHEFIQAKNQ